MDQAALPGLQGRLALVYLVAHRDRPVPVDALARAIWDERLPSSWEGSLRALVSKLRRVLRTVAPHADLVVADSGCYQARLADAWVDIEVARNALDRAEGAWRRGDVSAAWSDATVAAGITARPVLAGVDLGWVEQLRGEVATVWARALDVLGCAYLAGGQHAVAAAVAQRLIDAEPFRESAHRLLMRSHLAGGSDGEAVAVYTRLRERLREELGVAPSPATEAVFRQALRPLPADVDGGVGRSVGQQGGEVAGER
ncbi:MAG: BTAD domain-containing putative transcriptional regulator [Nitriliruptoraceae bacterium]